MAYRFSKASILVVDDMKPMLSLTVSLLEIFGFQNVYASSNPEQAFKIFCKHNPDIVLTDWQMEPFDGLELTRRIRNEPISPNRYVPIILMTGYSAEVRVKESRDIGVTEFLVKPFTANDLYVRIEHLVEKPRRFVDAAEFFGPDRRRRVVKDFDGPFCREGDEKIVAADAATDASESRNKEIAAILDKLRKDAGKA